VNADGQFDLFVTNFQRDYNTLYENLGNDLFQDVTSRYGLVTEALPNIGWGTAFADFNLDGILDLIVTNGHVDNNREEFGEDAPYQEPPLAYLGAGKKFKYLGAEAGEYFRKLHVGRGLAIVDLDNDGDQDVVITHQDDGPVILRNEALPARQGQNHAFVARLVGTRANRDAVGATVIFRAGSRELRAPVKGGGSYLSASDPRLTFASRPEEREVAVEVHWPGGAVSSLTGLQPDQQYVLIEPSAAQSSLIAHRVTPPGSP